MSETKTNKNLALAFAELSKAAARRKIYSHKAARDGRPEVAHFLRAMAASDAVQARRLFNSLIGRVDKSDDYLATVFEKEVQGILDRYTELITTAADGRPAVVNAVSQLRAAETRLRSFYSRNNRDVKADKDTSYFVCRFCGYVSTGSPPEKCPICTAPREAFNEVD